MDVNKNIRMSTYVLIFFGIIMLFHYQLMTALVGGISMYIIVNTLHDFTKTKIHSKTAKQITILFLSLIIFLILALTFSGFYYILTVGQDNFANLGEKAFSTLELLKFYIPEKFHHYLPENLIELKEGFLSIVKKSAPDMLLISKNITVGLIHILIGMFIGALIAIIKLDSKIETEVKIFKEELFNRIKTFLDVFHKVVFAQVKISAINAILTGIYLLIVLPIIDVNMPYAKTLVVLTFLFGLLPVVGNLISNTLITLISLNVSFNVAIYSLIFLIVVHKLEYYINAKIVGEKIKTSIWELLIAMLVFESIFGVIGAVLSPVIYGYVKEELKKNNLI